MKDDRPIWLTSLAEADSGVSAPERIAVRLENSLRRRRTITIAQRAGLASLAAAVMLGIWIPSHRTAQVIDGSYGYDDFGEMMTVAGDDDGDFVPTMLASEQPLESVRVVRVSLSVAALAGFGVRSSDLPASGEVTADLVLGQDGIARAVRVVK